MPNPRIWSGVMPNPRISGLRKSTTPLPARIAAQKRMRPASAAALPNPK